MDAGVRNKLTGTIEEIQSDGIMTLVNMSMQGWQNAPIVASVMTTQSLEDAGFKEGDQVEALIKAVNVVFVKH